MFGLITLELMAGVLIYTVIQACFSPKSLCWTIPVDAIMFGIMYGIEYESEIYQQISTITGWNAFLLLIDIVISVLLGIAFNGSNFKNAPHIIAVILLVLCFGVHGFISINTNVAMKRSANSIRSTRMTESGMPTLNHTDTPETLAPSTVFYQISNNWSAVPHPQAYSIARNSDNKKEIQAQYYHGKPVYIVPIEFTSHANYHYYRTIPGYWRMSATNPNAEPHFVKKTMRYSDSSYFNHNVDRDIYTSHLHDIDLSNNAQLEISNSGHPYYVETLRDAHGDNNRADFRKLQVSVEDAVNGKVHFYKHLSQAPKFIDESITSDVARDIATDYGENRGGYWNINGFFIWGGHEYNVMKPTSVGAEDDMTTVFHKGHISYVTDVTTPGKGHSALGSVAVNGRTGHVDFYRIKGINDSERAEGMANRQFDQHQDWTADNPILYDVDGTPTWVLNILDSEGQIKYFFYVDAKNSNHYDYASTPKEGLAEYKSDLGSNGGSNSSSSATKTKKIKGTVDRVFVNSGHLIFTLSGSHRVYKLSLSSTSPSHLVKSGDKVSFIATPSGVSNSAKDLEDSSLD